MPRCVAFQSLGRVPGRPGVACQGQGRALGDVADRGPDLPRIVESVGALRRGGVLPGVPLAKGVDGESGQGQLPRVENIGDRGRGERRPDDSNGPHRGRDRGAGRDAG